MRPISIYTSGGNPRDSCSLLLTYPNSPRPPAATATPDRSAPTCFALLLSLGRFLPPCTSGEERRRVRAKSACVHFSV